MIFFANFQVKRTWSLAKRVVKGDNLTALTRVLTVPHFLIAVEVSEDMKVKLASAAVTRRNVSSPPCTLAKPRWDKKRSE